MTVALPHCQRGERWQRHDSAAALLRTNPPYEAGTLLGGAGEDGLVGLIGEVGLLALISVPASFPAVRLACARIPWSMPELSV